MACQMLHFPAVVVSTPTSTISISAGHICRLHLGSPARGTVTCRLGANVRRSDQPAESATLRRSAHYQPTQWHDSFIQALNSKDPKEEGDTSVRLEELKGMVRDWINDANAGAAEKLELYDVLRRLGVAYHFERDIKVNLQTLSFKLEDVLREFPGDLHHAALLFRLLREHGLTAQQDVFDMFRDESDGFKNSLKDDVEGILSLYEASFLAFPEEKDLEEAMAFAEEGLLEFLQRTKMIGDIDAAGCDVMRLRERVEFALEMPMHWRMPRLYSRWFIDAYLRDKRASPILLELAVLDFNVVQSAHKRDIKETSRWWKDLGLHKELPFARDRLMESFYWTVGVIFEPHFWLCRRGLTRVNALISTIDDVYDVYGSLDELESFTVAVERWDVDAIDELPEYMRVAFRAVWKTTNELADQCFRRNGFDCLPYLRKSWIGLCKAYLVEARWYYSMHTPTLEEYLENARVSISAPVILTHGYFLSSEKVTEEALNSITDVGCCELLRWSSMILRLTNDLGTSAAEMERGDAPSSIQCLMHESSLPEAVARADILTLIGDAWKEINRAFQLGIRHLPTPFARSALNLARMSQLVYRYGDEFGSPGTETKDFIKLLLFEPIGDKPLRRGNSEDQRRRRGRTDQWVIWPCLSEGKADMGSVRHT